MQAPNIKQFRQISSARCDNTPGCNLCKLLVIFSRSPATIRGYHQHNYRLHLFDDCIISSKCESHVSEMESISKTS